jgi:hypothetical protein
MGRTLKNLPRTLAQLPARAGRLFPSSVRRIFSVSIFFYAYADLKRKGEQKEFWPDGRVINDSDLIICCSPLN